MLRHYTFSLAMCWVAAQRGARMAGARPPRPRGSWDARPTRCASDAASAYNEELGFFTQALDGEHPDASNLLLPTLGLIDARDPRFVSTVRAYERLVETA